MSKLGRQFRPAMRTVRPAAFHTTPATGTCGLHCRSAMRTEYKSGRNGLRAPRARFRQGLAQDKIENDADAVGNEKRQQRPHHIRHSAPFRVAIDIAHEQHECEHDERDAKRKQNFPYRIPFAHVPITRQGNRVQKNAKTEISDHRKNPCNPRDHPQLSVKSAHANLLSRRC